MPCENYKDALIETAASGKAPQGELRAHLGECASCRSAFSEEQSLFATIDSGLHATANAEVPPSFLPRLRADLDQAVVLRFRWGQWLVFASATVTLAFMVFLVVQRSHSTPENNVAKQEPVVVPSDTNPGKAFPSVEQIASPSARPSHSRRNSTSPHPAASGSPGVLVPPDEREAFALFVAVLSEHRDVAAALVAKVPQEDGVVTADPLRIPDIEIKPLEGTEAETAKGPSEKH